MSMQFVGDVGAHTPPKIKPQEYGRYNVFWVDVSQEKRPFKLDPNWMMKGIIINWLVKEGDIQGYINKLIIGIEATKAEYMQAFIKKFNGLDISLKDCQKMLMLGHPTLSIVLNQQGPKVQCNERDPDNYVGVLGGELWYKKKGWFGDKRWVINYHSGRFGDQHIKDNFMKQHAKSQAKLLFAHYTGVDVDEE